MCKKCKPLHCVCLVTIPQRLVVIIICLLGLFISRAQRSYKTFEYACNATTVYISYTNGTFKAKFNPYEDYNDYNSTEEEEEQKDEPEHVWRDVTKGVEKMLFLYGYMFGHWAALIPAGILADVYGAKWFYCGGIAVSSLLTLIIRLLLYFRAPWLIMIFVRILLGVSQSVIYPCISVLAAHWIPPRRRGLFGGFCYASYPFLNFLGDYLLMHMTKKRLSWPYLYYISAASGFMWCIISAFFIYETPEKHPRITERERNYLTRVMMAPSNLKLPFSKITHDRGVWALILGQVGHDFPLYVLRYVLLKPGISGRILQRFVLTTTFFLTLWPMGAIIGWIVDYGMWVNRWNVRTARRATTGVAFITSCAFLILSSYMSGEAITITIFFGMAIIFLGPNYAGHKINHMDITVNFNGTLIGIMCFTSDTSVLVLGVLSGNVIAPKNDVIDFHKEAWFTFAVSFVFTMCYMLMLKVKRADWDKPPPSVTDDFQKYQIQHESPSIDNVTI